MLQETKSNGTRPVVVSDAKDELTEHSRGYGKLRKNPEDYLNAFSRLLKVIEMNCCVKYYLYKTKGFDKKRFEGSQINT